MAEAQRNIFDLADSLAQKIPFIPVNVEAELGSPLTNISKQPYLTHYVSNPIALRDGVTAKASLALGPNNEFRATSGLSLHVSGQCITLKDVRTRYGQVVLTQLPRGHSRQETIDYAIRVPSADLTFGFTEDNPDCLKFISIRPHVGEAIVPLFAPKSAKED